MIGPPLLGLVDRLRYHELSRQGLGLLLLWVCAWFTEPAGEGRIVAGFVIGMIDCMVLTVEEPDLLDELMARSADYFAELVRRAIDEGVDIARWHQ